MRRLLAEIRPTLALATPIVIGLLSTMLMGVTDSVMIGRAGTVALAASAFGGNVFGVFYVAGLGLLLPVAIFVSRARGAKSPAEAGEYLRHGLALALALGAVEVLVMAALGGCLGVFRQPPEVLAAVNPFYLLIAASLPAVLVYVVLRQFAEAMGRPWVPTLIMLAGVGLNAALNWVFIYGHLGAPALGLAGAGISTLLSRSLGAAVIFWRLKKDPVLREALPKKWLGHWSRARFREMLGVGLPAGGMLLFESTAFAFSCVMVGWLGAVPLAAHQVAISCASLAFMVPLGLSMATGMRVSRAVGAGERARLRPIAFGSLAAGAAVTGLFGLGFFFGGGVIARWFTADPAVIAVATSLLAVAGGFQLADGGQVIGAASLRGITDVKVPALITFLAYWGVALPGGYLFGIRGGGGAVAIWSSIAAGLACAAGLLAWRFARLTRSDG